MLSLRYQYLYGHKFSLCVCEVAKEELWEKKSVGSLSLDLYRAFKFLLWINLFFIRVISFIVSLKTKAGIAHPVKHY
ncbi:hypothetical protein EYC80_006128 [Monilinia laxa]|uniref:Uncharacterized protein n=1 Tax=Monilinia laxa TaxID=61186 RepID=A0A5N6KGF8_MONLA|nr:hypothetical protein EYC80_006128 [Monilinia laxa]